MSDHSIIDSHLHLWNPTEIRYPWLDDNALLNRPYMLHDYEAATAGLHVEGMVFVQCEADSQAFVQEAAWVAELAGTEPRIKALVAWAPLEKGARVSEDLEKLKVHDTLRGIRRIIQFEPDLDFCLRPDFVEGVRTLADFDLSFDICIDHRQMANLLKLAELTPDVPMVLDHIGKPAIRDGVTKPWASQIRALAQFPHVQCKISGVATEADHGTWSPDQLRPYIETAIEAFGFDRIMFGGDWPVSTQAIGYSEWVHLLDDILKGTSPAGQRSFWRDNAASFYRI